MNMIKKTISFLSVLFLFTSCSQDQYQELLTTDDTKNSFALTSTTGLPGYFETGGSNYPTYNAQNWINNAIYYHDSNTDPAWSAANLFLTVGELPYDIAQVNSQLTTMFNNGQRKIAIPIWFSVFPNSWPPEQLFEKHMLRIDSGKLTDEQETNFKNLLQSIYTTGYNEVVIRFNAQWLSQPDGWIKRYPNGNPELDSSGKEIPIWDENMYQKNLSFIFRTIDITNQKLANSGVKILYDLGGELGGINKGCSSPYVTRLWTDYINKYGNNNSYGFSVIYEKNGDENLLNHYILELKSTNKPLPSEYAIDLYCRNTSTTTSTTTGLSKIKSILVNQNEAHKNIIIQETFYNDTDNFNKIIEGSILHNLKIRTIYQWPLTKDSPIQHINVSYPFEYKIAPYITNSGAGCDDGNCIWITGHQFNNINNNIHVDIREPDTWEVLNSYAPNEITNQNDGTIGTIALRLKSDREKNLFKTKGLRVFVINSNNGTWSTYGNTNITK